MVLGKLRLDCVDFGLGILREEKDILLKEKVPEENVFSNTWMASVFNL